MRQDEQPILTLSFVCSILSPWTSEEETSLQRAAASNNKVDWQDVALCVNRSNLVPALHWALDQKGFTAHVPNVFLEYLETIYQFNLTRNSALTQQLVEIVKDLNSEEVTPLLLKGGAALLTNLYPGPGIRFMCDLDVLVPEEMRNLSVSTLMSKGYQVPEKYAEISYAGKEHAAPLWRPDVMAAVEVHSRLFENDYPFLRTESLWAQSQKAPSQLLTGLSAQVMSPTDEVIYCFAHSELKHEHHERELLDLRQLYHFSWLCHRHQNEVDWGRVAALASHARFGPAFRAYLYMAKRLFNVELPITYEKDQNAEAHYLKVLAAYSGWGKRRNFLRLLLRNMKRSFSKEQLQAVYPENNGHYNVLRAKYLWTLMGRYGRADAWRAKFRNLDPF